MLARASLPAECDAISGGRLLQALTARGRDSEVLNLIARGFDTRSGIIHTAAAVDSVPVLEALLADGCDINSPGTGGATPLMTAIEFGARRVVRFLINAGADLGAEDDSGATAAHYAAAAGDADLTAFLMRTSRSRGSTVPIIAAAAIGDHVDLIRALAASGEDVNAAGESRKNWVEPKETRISDIIEELEMPYGDSIPESIDSSQAIFCSSIGFGPRIVSNNFLKGRPSEFSSFGTQKKGGESKRAKTPNRYRILYVTGGTALHVAAQFGSLKAIEALIEAGADINASYKQKTPLLRAISADKYRAAELLIKHGAKIPPSAEVTFTSLALRRLLKEHNITAIQSPLVVGNASRK